MTEELCRAGTIPPCVPIAPSEALAAAEQTRRALRGALAAGRARPAPRARFEGVLGVPLPDSKSAAALERWTLIGGNDDADAGQRDIPILLMRPAGAAAPPSPQPAVLLLHSTHSSKEMFADTRGGRAGVAMLECVRRGLVAVSMDLRHHGARGDDGAYTRAMRDAWRSAHRAARAPRAGTRDARSAAATPSAPGVVVVTPSTGVGGASTAKLADGDSKPKGCLPSSGLSAGPYLMDSAWDVQRVLDWLETRACVRSPRNAGGAGIVGVSLGGSVALLAAAADERLTAVAPLIGLQSLRYALQRKAFHARVDSFRPRLTRSQSDAMSEEQQLEAKRTAFDGASARLSRRATNAAKSRARVRAIHELLARAHTLTRARARAAPLLFLVRLGPNHQTPPRT